MLCTRMTVCRSLVTREEPQLSGPSLCMCFYALLTSTHGDYLFHSLEVDLLHVSFKTSVDSCLILVISIYMK